MTTTKKNESTIAERIAGFPGEWARNYMGEFLAGSRFDGWEMHPLHVMAVPMTNDAVLNAGATHRRTGTVAGAQLRLSDRSTYEEWTNALSTLSNDLRQAILQKIATPERVEESDKPAVIRFLLEPGATKPVRSTDGASGYDLYSPIDVMLAPRHVIVIHVGVRLELPPGYEGQIRPRSGMTKKGIWVAIGTVDSDYRGVIGASCVNLTPDSVKIAKGDRIAQLVIAKVEHLPWIEVGELGETVRGAGGFGSTGA